MAHISYTSGRSIEAVIGRFREFLTSVWPVVSAIMEEHDWDDDAYFLDDWLDANWQLLVARQLVGMGGNLQPLTVATNDILKRPFTYWLECQGGTFVSLGSVRKSFEVAPPFDMVKIMKPDGSIEVLPWLSLKFELRKAI